MSGNGEMVELLIQKGADVNIAKLDGTSPLHTAASKGKHKIDFMQIYQMGFFMIFFQQVGQMLSIC